MSRPPWLSSGLTSILIACLLINPVEARQTGRIEGSVRDQVGDPLAGVSVTLRGSTTLEGKTDSAGRFDFSNLPPADYELTAVLSGFDVARDVVRVEPAATTSISLTMRLTVREQVLVTAARTGATDVQAVPIAVSSLSSEELTRLPIRSLEQAAPALPSVTFTQNTTFGQLSIRGIGTTTTNAGGDPGSALYADGVYLARPAMAFVDFLDLERVEVLRGPQGTLYGRNAVGGAMQLISRTPTNELDAAVRLTGGNLREARADAHVSGALKRDRLMGSIAFAKGVREGYVRDLERPDQRLGADDVTAARGQLRVVFNPRSEALIATDVSDQRGTPLTYNKVLEVKPGFNVANPSSLYDVRTSMPAASRRSRNRRW